MANINWKLDRAIAIDNFRIEKEDGSSVLMDGVIRDVVLCASVMIGEKEHTNKMMVTLKEPAVDVFLPLSSVDETRVFTWAMDAFGDIAKARVEKRMSDFASFPQPIKRIIFNK